MHSQKHDLEALRGKLFGSSYEMTCLDRITQHDLVLCNETDDNSLMAISAVVNVLYRQPDADLTLPPMAPNTYICRYSVTFGTNSQDRHSNMKLVPYLGENDNWKDIVLNESAKKHRGNNDMDMSSSRSASPPTNTFRLESSEGSDSSSENDDDNHDEGTRTTGKMDEGNGVKRETRVGPAFQVTVPPFQSNSNSNNRKSISRKPALVWKIDRLSNNEIAQFLSGASHILVPFLNENSLVHVEPYSPLAWDETEALANELEPSKPQTLSSICTGASLARKRTDMLREMDVDALITLLHKVDYNVAKALERVQADPHNFVTSWTMMQKEALNVAFRRYAGSLQMVHRALASEKSFKEIVDYVYRFKIPDQFRLFQEAKQEQAIRMLERIENLRDDNTVINVDRERVEQQSEGPSPRRKARQDNWYVPALLVCWCLPHLNLATLTYFPQSKGRNRRCYGSLGRSTSSSQKAPFGYRRALWENENERVDGDNTKLSQNPRRHSSNQGYGNFEI